MVRTAFKRKFDAQSRPRYNTKKPASILMAKQKQDMGGNGADSSNSLLELINARLQSLQELPECAIFRVPRILRQVDPSAYEPMFVSIGPYHYKPSLPQDHHVSIDIDKENRPKLQQGQDLKWHFFKDFLDRSKVPRAEYVSLIESKELKARKCYIEDVSLASNEFNQVMLLDGCFILEFCIKEIHGGHSSQTYSQHGNNMRLNWVYEDILLLENQLPLFILEDIYNLFRTGADHDRFPHSLDYLVLKMFKSFLDNSFGENQEQLQISVESKGDGCQDCHSPSKYHHLVHLVHDHLIRPPGSTSTDNSNCDVQIDRSASTLQAMGVKIVRPREKTSLFDIEFDNGTLQLPHLYVTDSTSQVLRNFIAFEQTSESVYHYFSPYGFFMDDLINTVRDVDTLEKCGVLTSHIGSNKNVVNLFNKIGLGCIEDSDKNYLRGIQTQLEQYCKIRCHRWRAKLVDDYFGNPWSIFSLLAAIALLLLTVLQTIFAILSYTNARKSYE